MSSKPLFQLRKELDSSNEAASDTEVTQSFVEQFQVSNNIEPYVSDKFTNEVVLTENEKYTVSKLPSSLNFLPESPDLDGLVDAHSGNAIVNDNDNLYIWAYRSTQAQPSVSRIPLHEEHISQSSVPKVVFTWPAAMDDESAAQSSGVCIVNRKSGLVQFYEDVDTINHLSSLLSKSKCHELNLKLKDKETVEDVVNCEPAGILISTSKGRALFVTIRDFSGKPRLHLKAQLVKSHLGFFFSPNKFKKVVSIKPGHIPGKGERLAFILTSGGDFHVWNLSAVSNCHRKISINLYDQILESLQDLYPFAHSSLLLLDSHPLDTEGSAHMVLSSITNYDGACYYILTTIKIDESTNSFAIFSTYRLNTYVSAFSEENRPRLIVPLSSNQDASESTEPSITSVYTIFPDAVVLTQVSAKLDQTYSLRRKWEDIISFRDDVNIIGHGNDSESVYLISRGMGVLMVTTSKTGNTSGFHDVRFIKSHIQQAVYFSGLSSSPIDFNLSPDISLQREEIEEDLLASSNEILLSKSIYIPPKLKSLERHASMRVGLYRRLLAFTKSNFLNKISPSVKIELIESFEVLNASSQLLPYTEKSKETKEVWLRVLEANGVTEEDFMRHDLDKFPKVLSQFLQQLQLTLASTTHNKLWPQCIEMIISCLYRGALEDGEEYYRFGMFEMDKHELHSQLPWYVQHSIPEAVNNLLYGLVDYSKMSQDSEQHADQILSLVKALYYMSNQTSLWLQQDTKRADNNDCTSVSKLFKENRLSWNEMLCDIGRSSDSLHICEFYEDLPSLAQTLNTLPNEASEGLYTHYFQKFGYNFAAQLFTNYITHGRLQELYNKFGCQNSYLKKFFDENLQFAEVGWMEKILNEQYSEAADILTKISTDNKKAGNLDRDQTRLSVAKLCVLASEASYEFENLTMIQSGLDIIDGQKDLAAMLESGIKLHKRFEECSAVQKLYKRLSENISASNRLTLSEVVEMYTILNSKEGFFRALKLLSLVKVSMDFEKIKFLEIMIWRRCILFDNMRSLEETSSALFHTLKKSFDDQLYLSAHFTLPSLTALLDKTTVTSEYFAAEYDSRKDDVRGLFESVAEEQSEIMELSDELSPQIKSVIAASNDSSTQKCVINYETNQIEGLT
ncbi:Nup133p [Lachancea thermotolerans CBS 6340]|uniref:KLTH0F17798p n=1 Tax=Lachancea thermotolerans (strain ATCC 56472 / CBS 6340 / NRRL Y-8284) TaxID=559295 RepID=C5DJN2_LACTC|nr:KLTH0F17798p [Lachancea thermotolerans CBS 6340]CAR24521.1 KLTH0F17798p [Lachancea thermotolerans CBS 6340]